MQQSVAQTVVSVAIMGFTTGFVHLPRLVSITILLTTNPQIGGVTLTTSLLYLTVSIHQRNRAAQSMLLRHQAATLNNFVEPPPSLPLSTAREARVNWAETWKDRWNAELENATRRFYTVNWNEVRDGFESRVATLWARAFREAMDEAPSPPETEGAK